MNAHSAIRDASPKSRRPDWGGRLTFGCHHAYGLCSVTVSRISTIPTKAGTRSARQTTNTSRSGQGPYCTNSPPTIGPIANPATEVVEAWVAALRVSPCGSRSASVAVAAPVKTPTAKPETIRAASRSQKPLAKT